MTRLGALVAAILLVPLLLLIAVAVLLEDGLPVFYSQIRVGKGGKLFRIRKFRSMSHCSSGIQLTARSDARVTRVGRVLRRYKLDEIPQLWNLFRGDMNVVGPRPEVPVFVDAKDPLWKATLLLRPGLTCLATLVYRNEEDILAKAPDAEQYYLRVLLPEKLSLNLEYARRRHFRSDCKLLMMTAICSVFPDRHDPERVRQVFLTEECTR